VLILLEVVLLEELDVELEVEVGSFGSGSATNAPRNFPRTMSSNRTISTQATAT
jgi:hypothetical protein